MVKVIGMSIAAASPEWMCQTGLPSRWSSGWPG